MQIHSFLKYGDSQTELNTYRGKKIAFGGTNIELTNLQLCGIRLSNLSQSEIKEVTNKMCFIKDGKTYNKLENLKKNIKYKDDRPIQDEVNILRILMSLNVIYDLQVNWMIKNRLSLNLVSLEEHRHIIWRWIDNILKS